MLVAHGGPEIGVAHSLLNDVCRMPSLELYGHAGRGGGMVGRAGFPHCVQVSTGLFSSHIADKTGAGNGRLWSRQGIWGRVGEEPSGFSGNFDRQWRPRSLVKYLAYPKNAGFWGWSGPLLDCRPGRQGRTRTIHSWAWYKGDERRTDGMTISEAAREGAASAG